MFRLRFRSDFESAAATQRKPLVRTGADTLCQAAGSGDPSTDWPAPASPTPQVELDPMQRFASERPATVGAVIAEDPGEEHVAGEEEVTILEGGPGEEQASPEEGSPENSQEEN